MSIKNTAQFKRPLTPPNIDMHEGKMTEKEIIAIRQEKEVMECDSSDMSTVSQEKIDGSVIYINELKSFVLHCIESNSEMVTRPLKSGDRCFIGNKRQNIYWVPKILVNLRIIIL